MKTLRLRRSREDARAEIIAAAQEALSATGLSALTVDDVMRRTGMTRSSFYHYFSGLDEVVLGLLEGFEQAIRASVDPWLEGADEDDPIRATTTHLTAMFEVMQAHRTSVKAVSQAAGGRPKVYEEWQTRVLDYFIDRTARFIGRQVALGRSRADDPQRLAQALILMNNAVATDNMAREADDDPAAIAGVVAGIWNAAIYGRTD